MHLLVQADDSGLCGRMLRHGVQGFLGRDPGVPAFPYHFQCGCEHDGASLGLAGGRGKWGPIGMGGLGANLRLLLLHR